MVKMLLEHSSTIRDLPVPDDCTMGTKRAYRVLSLAAKDLMRFTKRSCVWPWYWARQLSRVAFRWAAVFAWSATSVTGRNQPGFARYAFQRQKEGRPGALRILTSLGVVRRSAVDGQQCSTFHHKPGSPSFSNSCSHVCSKLGSSSGFRSSVR